MSKRALIYGANGQLGSYLTELLIAEGTEVLQQTSATQTYALEYGEPFSEIYVLHITRPDWHMISYEAALSAGLMEVAYILDNARGAKVLVPDSAAALRPSTDPWSLDKALTRQFVANQPDSVDVVMPLLDQYVSVKGPRKRMYLMEILHQIAEGRTPEPLRPADVVHPDHAKNGAIRLRNEIRGIRGPYPVEEMSVAEFITAAKTPGRWIAEIVDELRGAK